MPRIAAVVPDLMFASKIEATLAASGHEVTVVPSLDALQEAGADPQLVIADLAETDPARLSRTGLPVLGFYPHVDVELRRRAESAGIASIVPRSRMAREMPALVDSLLA